ncbi:asparagine synthase (glutamine-hydrolyzing) [Actinomadura hibisca]|uniref:asparagine synthase (glutamine-hydrolyzing) n=1 Tax=Actinomadura hibisca TaxID=68565 RepID=A0SZV7_9ACTN|nr:asparagine synthase (glutamine-hydrolyzing) [Actinomadura hibisca]ABK58686.1 PdmN [Actinomadura hibisca]
MSGFAGWVDYERDLRREGATTRTMTATMACRGPDAEEVWLSERAAFGHRRLAVLDPKGGRQPMRAEHDGRELAVLAFNGEIYNAGEVRAELAARGHRFRTRSDTEVILEAYLEWGAGCAAKLNGIFAFAVWDPRSEELLLARDQLGAKPVIYYPTPTGVLFASEPKALLAHPWVDAVVDTDGFRELLSQAGTPGAVVFKGMHEVRAGHVVRIGERGIVTEKYWGLEGREHTDDRDATIANVRRLLEESIGRQLRADVPVCSLLSGGLDSSGLTAIAAHILAERGEGPVRTFTVDYAGLAENFVPDQVRTSLDAPYVKDLVAHVGSEHTDVMLDTSDLLDPVMRAETIRARDLPSPLGDMQTGLYLLYRAAAEHSTVALTGQLADSLFGGPAWVQDPEFANADTFPWVALAQRRACPDGLGNGLLAPALRRSLDIPGYVRDRFHEALAEVPHVGEADPQERRMREITYTHLTRYPETLIRNDERLSAYVGLETRVPFCDPELLQYAFNTPWHLQTFDGREKSLLRAAVADLLPESVLKRPKSPFPVSVDPGYAKVLRTELSEILADPSAPVAPFLDPQGARELLDDPNSLAEGWRGRTNVELILQLDTWLRDYGVRLDLDV